MNKSMCSKEFKKRLITSAIAACVAAGATASFADEGGAGFLELEEIVVTARKRAQSLQDIPQSVAVTTGESLRETGTTNLQALTDGAPTITVVRSPLNDSLYIRGVGSGDNPGFQQSVGTFVDGIYRGRGAASRGAFLDVDRVEVLRGPQPIYFGNSTIGGAFNIVTRGPGDELEANFRTSYEFNADEWITEGGVGGPITETIGARVAVLYTDSEGWMDDTVQNSRGPGDNNKAIRTTLKFDPKDSYDATLKIEYSDINETGSPIQRLNCNAETNPATYGPTCNPGIFLTPGFEDKLDWNLSRGGVLPDGTVQSDSNDLESTNIVLQQNFQFNDNITVSSVTGWVDYTSDRQVDADVGPSVFIQAERYEELEQFSQELRLTYDGDSGLSYMVGVYYDNSDLFFRGDPVFGPLGAPGSGLENGARVNSHFTQDQESIGVFGSVAYNITDRLTLTLGARWSQVEIDAIHEQTVTNLDGSAASPFLLGAVRFGPLSQDQHFLEGSKKDNDLTPSIELQFDATDDVMVYVSYKEAFKTGGFDANIPLAELAEPTANDANGGFEFEAEEASAYEIGVKTQLFDGSMTMNISAFRTEFENLQVSTFDGITGTFLTSNAAESVSQGIEMDVVARVNEYLKLTVAGTYLDSTYRDYDGAQCNQAQAAAFIASGATGLCLATLDGEKTPYAPDFSGSIGYSFNYPITGNMELVSSGQVTYTDEFFNVQNPDDVMIQDSFTKVNARLGVSGNDGQWEVAFYGKNLTDEITYRNYFISATGGDFAVTDRRRELGLQFAYNY